VADERPSHPTTYRVEVAPRTLLMIACALALVWLADQLWNVVLVVVVALVLVGTLDPMVAWLERRGLGRGRSLALICVAIVIAIAGALVATVPALVSQVQHIIEDLPHERDRVVEMLGGLRAGEPFAHAIQSAPIDTIVLRAGNGVLGYSPGIIAGVGYAITTVFLAIYLLADPRQAKSMLYSAVPRHYHVKLARILRELRVIVGGYMRGQLITSVAIGVFVFAVMTILGVDDALAIAVFAAFTDIIPFVGGYLASGPAVLAVSGRGTVTIVLVVALMVLYQEFESRILVPRVYGRTLRMSPATVLVALLIGGTLMGVIGALLALPIAAALRLLLRELRVEMPGAPHDRGIRETDDRAEQLYESLAEGTPAAEAAEIADEVAKQVVH
jgi:predicted PurR-regulated permease PerM